MDLHVRPRLCIDGGLSTRDLGDELLAYDRERHQVHVLNSTAREIHGWCDGDSTVGDIADRLVELYSIEREIAVRDVIATLQRLSQLGLVEMTD